MKFSKILLFYILLSISTILIAQNNSNDTLKLSYELLNHFKNNDLNGLKSWFTYWEKESILNNKKQSLDIESEILQIHKLIFETSRNTKQEYYVFSNKIHFKISNSEILKKEEVEDSIYIYRKQNVHFIDFCPDISNLNKKTLFLNDKYWKALNYFFNENNLMTPIVSDNSEMYNKHDFIKPYIPLNHFHDYYGYAYVSFPEINFIYFNKTITQAIAFLGTSSCSREDLLLEKKNETWEITKRLSEWIE
ncbi:MAG: hypothetical protein HQ522_11250 [Bacteroidetes bacterium]|nr:hypothetical protein [Bacteroidota bacterium]